MDIDYSSLPHYMQDGVRRYIEDGIPPGGFLTAVICNDLFGAFAKADHVNQRAMKDYVVFFYNEAPCGCWGSREVMNTWIDQHKNIRRRVD
jgi:hypothetical protein